MHTIFELPDFSHIHILVIGDVMLDRYWFGETNRISPEAPVPVVKINATDNRPGGAGNVAINIASLGAKVSLIGLVGRDEAAQLLRDQLSAANVTHQLIDTKNSSTVLKLRVISKHQQLMRLDFEKTLMLDEPETLMTVYEKCLETVDLVILSDYNKGTLFDPQKIIQIAHRKKIPCIVDPKRTQFEVYKKANLITPNLKEFEMAAGICQNENEILNKAKLLLKAHEFGGILITRGEKGMTLINEEGIYHLPAYAKEVFDVTGAGDTVIGILGLCLAAKLNLKDSMTLANLAASITVSKLGAATVSLPELKFALHHQLPINNGIMNEKQLLEAVKYAKKQGKKIVFTNGCFDILHAGHVTYLQMAKATGDYLIVAVNSDESIRQLKGQNRPINNLEHRMTVLSGLGVVDWVIPFKDETPSRLLHLIQPDFLVKGSDYQLKDVVGADIVKAYGGEVRIMKHGISQSSSDILAKLS